MGRELQKHLEVDAPLRKEMDITSPITWDRKYSLVIHAAAYTDVAGAEVERELCHKTNVIGTLNVIKAFPDTPIVYISTEYVYNPVNFYTETKIEGEEVITNSSSPSLIIRTLFKPTPFPHERAFIDQYTRGDYVNKIAPLIVKEIFGWDEKRNKIVDIGTGRKTMFELAKRTRPDVKPCSVDDIKTVKLPKDYEINTEN